MSVTYFSFLHNRVAVLIMIHAVYLSFLLLSVFCLITSDGGKILIPQGILKLEVLLALSLR